MRKWIVAGVLFLALSLAAALWGSQWIIGLFVPAEQDRIAQAYLEDLRSGNFAPFEAALDPSLKAQNTPALEKQLQSVLAAEPLTNRQVVGSHTGTLRGSVLYALSYEYQAGTHWLLAEMVLQAEKGGPLRITGIHLTPMAQSLEQVNAFTLSGRKVASWMVLAAAPLVAGFTLWTAIVCWRTPIPKRKWLWRIFVLLGLTGFILNWTTQKLEFRPIQISLLGAAFNKQFYGPLMLQVGFPLGAILFWARRKAWRRQVAEAAARGDLRA